MNDDPDRSADRVRFPAPTDWARQQRNPEGFVPEWEQPDWDEPPPLDLPGPLSLLPALPRAVQIALLIVWWLIATVTYQSMGMGIVPAALVTLISLVAFVGALLLYLWTRRKAWREVEREELWRLCGWGAVGLLVVTGLPAVAAPVIVLSVLAIYAVIVLPLGLLR